MKALRSLLIASLLAVATTASAQGSPFKFEFHGFTVGSMYMQNQAFLTAQGNGLLNAAPTPSNEIPRPGNTTDKAGTFFGADVRQSRFIFAMSGPQVMGGATPKAYFEGDFFGNLNAGALGYEAPNPRLRQAYAELKWGSTTMDVGQHSAQILLAQIPVSLAHITNPVPYGAGLIGWRSIGLRAFHLLAMDGWNLELGGEISHGKWLDANAAGPLPGNTANAISLAWASGTPQLVGRLKADGKSGGLAWMGWVAGSYESINLKGFGNTVAPNGITLQDGSNKTGLTSYAVTAGGRIDLMPVSLLFQGYTGRGTGPLAGTTIQFGDIGDVGYWAQLGFNATKEFSIWALYGASSADKKDLQNWLNAGGTRLTEANTAIRKDNQVFGGLVKYQDGGYAFGLEYYAYSTKYLLGNNQFDDGTKGTSAYQIIASGAYFF